MSNYHWGLCIFGLLFAANVVAIFAGIRRTRTPPNRYSKNVLPRPQAAAMSPRSFADT